jgi:hypothetical protein
MDDNVLITFDLISVYICAGSLTVGGHDNVRVSHDRGRCCSAYELCHNNYRIQHDVVRDEKNSQRFA